MPSLLRIWTLVGWLVFFDFSLTNSFSEIEEAFELRNDPSITYTYDRLDEVKSKCRSVLSSASELALDDNRVYSIRNELSFINGDWVQEAGGAPLMPFDDRKMLKNRSDHRSRLNLVSFWVTDVDQAHRSKNVVFVSGLLYLGITVDGSFARKPYDRSPEFQIWPGHSELKVVFQGAYTESKKNEGERVMCLLGMTVLPSRQPDSTDAWEWVKGSSYNYSVPSLLQDDQIMLVLRYPKTFTLTSRQVLGEMRSLNSKSNLKYFDKVLISSQLGPSANYKFGSEELMSKACNPYPYQDPLLDTGIEIYQGLEFCATLRLFTSGEPLSIVPNWKCNGTDDYCLRLGPFVSAKEINTTAGGFRSFILLMQDMRCEQGTKLKNSSSSRVSAVFRAVPPFENQFASAERTALSNMTLPAEGIWNSSSGQLCMVGCLGIVNEAAHICDSRICLYIPLTFSIKQRSIIVGSISSIANKTGSYFPLSFEMVVQPTQLWERFGTSHLSYRYSKISLAGAFLERSEPFNFGAVIKKSLLSYPTMEEAESTLVSLSLLSEDLTLHVSAFPDPWPSTHLPITDIQMEILSLGPLFGRYWSSQNGSTLEKEVPYHVKAESTERKLLLNVSAQLTLTGKAYDNFSVLFLEGIYNPPTGKMYLIGCRDVRASRKILFESMDLEAGLDCLIEVKAEYPPTTSRWLSNPAAKFSITSQRSEDDPLYFSPVKLQTLPILYRKQREDILSRRGVEGILRILTLTGAIACILSQLFYIRDNIDVAPFMSLVMLGVQALGYSIPLITGAETIIKRMASESYDRASYVLEKNQWYNVVDYTVKFLVLVAFLLTLRLWQKVWKSRVRLLTRTPLEPHHVPSDKNVLLTSLVIHAVGFIIILVIHSVNVSRRPLSSQKYVDPSGNTRALWEWETELQEYVGLVQDFFLLPQIIGNFLWQIHCKPLRNVYYVGVTLVRLLPHIYDYVRAPVSNPYFAEEHEFVNPSLDFFSKFGDVAIPVTAVILASVVYIQQRWSYEKISHALNLGQCKLLPMGPRKYERLPSKSFEAELVSGVSEEVADEREHDDKE